ncbi:hypothetical protein Ctob_007208 [Chrysochromulina tobinii]|uniref:Uncharacterized protein n=1 Tax=Chrysochromulina tobinii TaxID=1460289 RepID=A0A0M0K2U9_9EUKA|nr:hypothetical protein Ctob_007208 [Chrysochromulina tobinii]|eukprot:KOO33134.1 hypothetical protein Ctob_007208 [Chrysochromulina sp. CCMP291]
MLTTALQFTSAAAPDDEGAEGERSFRRGDGTAEDEGESEAVAGRAGGSDGASAHNSTAGAPAAAASSAAAQALGRLWQLRLLEMRALRMRILHHLNFGEACVRHAAIDEAILQAAAAQASPLALRGAPIGVGVRFEGFEGDGPSADALAASVEWDDLEFETNNDLPSPNLTARSLHQRGALEHCTRRLRETPELSRGLSYTALRLATVRQAERNLKQLNDAVEATRFGGESVTEYADTGLLGDADALALAISEIARGAAAPPSAVGGAAAEAPPDLGGAGATLKPQGHQARLKTLARAHVLSEALAALHTDLMETRRLSMIHFIQKADATPTVVYGLGRMGGAVTGAMRISGRRIAGQSCFQQPQSGGAGRGSYTASLAGSRGALKSNSGSKSDSKYGSTSPSRREPTSAGKKKTSFSDVAPPPASVSSPGSSPSSKHTESVASAERNEARKAAVEAALEARSSLLSADATLESLWSLPDPQYALRLLQRLALGAALWEIEEVTAPMLPCKCPLRKLPDPTAKQVAADRPTSASGGRGKRDKQELLEGGAAPKGADEDAVLPVRWLRLRSHALLLQLQLSLYRTHALLNTAEGVADAAVLLRALWRLHAITRDCAAPPHTPPAALGPRGIDPSASPSGDVLEVTWRPLELRAPERLPQWLHAADPALAAGTGGADPAAWDSSGADGARGFLCDSFDPSSIIPVEGARTAALRIHNAVSIVAKELLRLSTAGWAALAKQHELIEKQRCPVYSEAEAVALYDQRVLAQSHPPYVPSALPPLAVRAHRLALSDAWCEREELLRRLSSQRLFLERAAAGAMAVADAHFENIHTQVEAALQRLAEEIAELDREKNKLLASGGSTAGEPDPHTAHADFRGQLGSTGAGARDGAGGPQGDEGGDGDLSSQEMEVLNSVLGAYEGRAASQGPEPSQMKSAILKAMLGVERPEEAKRRMQRWANVDALHAFHQGDDLCLSVADKCLPPLPSAHVREHRRLVALAALGLWRAAGVSSTKLPDVDRPTEVALRASALNLSRGFASAEVRLELKEAAEAAVHVERNSAERVRVGKEAELASLVVRRLTLRGLLREQEYRLEMEVRLHRYETKREAMLRMVQSGSLPIELKVSTLGDARAEEELHELRTEAEQIKQLLLRVRMAAAFRQLRRERVQSREERSAGAKAARDAPLLSELAASERRQALLSSKLAETQKAFARHSSEHEALTKKHQQMKRATGTLESFLEEAGEPTRFQDGKLVEVVEGVMERAARRAAAKSRAVASGPSATAAGESSLIDPTLEAAVLKGLRAKESDKLIRQLKQDRQRPLSRRPPPVGP